MTFAVFYALLLAGSVTMIFPFLLMLGTSVTGEPDILEYRIVPDFLWRSDALFVRYAWSKYQDLTYLQPRYGLHGLARLELREMRPALEGMDAPALAAALRQVLVLRQAEARAKSAESAVEAAGGPDRAPRDLLEEFSRRQAELATVGKESGEVVHYLKTELSDLPDSAISDFLDRLGASPPADFHQAVDKAAPLGPLSAGQVEQLVAGRVLLDLKRDDPPRRRQVADGLAWLAELPDHLKSVAFNPPQLTTTGHINRMYRDFLRRKYPNVAAVNAAYQTRYESFFDARVPFERPEARDWVPTLDRRYLEFLQFKAAVPPEYFLAAEGDSLWQRHLEGTFDARIAALDTALGTAYRQFSEVPLPLSRPQEPPLAAHWNGFVRRKWPLRLMQFTDQAERAYRAFVQRKFREKLTLAASQPGALAVAATPLEQLNRDYALQLADWSQLRMPAPQEMVDMRLAHLEEFVRGRLVKPAEAAETAEQAIISGKSYADVSGEAGLLDIRQVRLFDATEHYRQYVRRRVAPNEPGDALALAAVNQAYGTRCRSWQDVRPPCAAIDWHVVNRDAAALRWQFVADNFREVIEFIAIKGRALWFTALFVGLTILAQLTVNPLAAYALSRYNLSYSNKVLLFLLATMAFPAEVEMIPRFLLLRGFPLWPILGGLVTAGVLLYLLLTRVKRLPALPAAAFALAIAALVGVFAVPPLASALGVQPVKPLLNTIWALVLPGMAGGFTIFILKGFFDTLPKELYEAGQLDGASELRMFWQITVPLCKPVFAYIALISFVGSYSAFIFALTVCQDPRSWTLMVWLYDLQTTAPDYIKVAAMCVAMVPTLVVFITCQRVIMRGIILPQMH